MDDSANDRYRFSLFTTNASRGWKGRVQTPRYREFCRAHCTGADFAGIEEKHGLSFADPEIVIRLGTITRGNRSLLQNSRFRYQLNLRKSTFTQEIYQADVFLKRL
jgi:hypothetical protein